jgi:hypothetical protein
VSPRARECIGGTVWFRLPPPRGFLSDIAGPESTGEWAGCRGCVCVAALWGCVGVKRRLGSWAPCGLQQGCLGTGLLAHCVQSAFHGLRFDTAPTDLTVLAHAGRWGLSGCKHWLIVAGGVVMPSGRAELARKFQLQISAGAKTEI